MGVNLKDARVEVEKVIGRGSGFVAVEIPFTPRAKRVLEMSLEEARQLGEQAQETHKRRKEDLRAFKPPAGVPLQNKYATAIETHQDT